MKQLLLIPVLLLACLFTNAQDYKWTVEGGSNAMYTMGDISGGALAVSAMYDLMPKLQAGATIGIGFGDMDDDAKVSATARYFVKDQWFAHVSVPLTDAAGDDILVGGGKRYQLGERVEFNPAVVYGTDSEQITLQMGFAIRF